MGFSLVASFIHLIRQELSEMSMISILVVTCLFVCLHKAEVLKWSEEGQIAAKSTPPSGKVAHDPIGETTILIFLPTSK